MLASAFSVLSELPVPGVCDLAGTRRKEGRICWRFPVLLRVLMHTAALALRWLLQQCQKRGLRPWQEGWFCVMLSTLPVGLGQGFFSTLLLPGAVLLSQNSSDGKATTGS